MNAFPVDNRTDGAFPVDLTINEGHGKVRFVIGRKGVELMTLAIDAEDLKNVLIKVAEEKGYPN